MEAIVTVDGVGRVVIPKWARALFKTQKFALQVESEEIRLKPVKTWDDLFGLIPELSLEGLKKMRREDAANDD